jgi:large subunit ribosomal protein L6|uniref:ribosomal protein L6 n=1 Tax=Fibrocapsa japonica TaxID=94617 RepID=UPI002113C747|nr:ribosomal protein L6 [Fibrocapsa japonica]UTE95145.1 ribosomal protein L6 [Fibrocapsa japonica]
MSGRRKCIQIPKNVDVTLEGNIIEIIGPVGLLNRTIPNSVLVSVDNDVIKIGPKDKKSKKSKSLTGLMSKEIFNSIQAVVKKIEYCLELRGVGYRAQVKENVLELFLGYSHPNSIKIIPQIEVSVEGNTKILIKGIEKAKIGLLASQIRYLRPPEPYKGKGIFYKGENIILKPGKSGKK